MVKIRGVLILLVLTIVSVGVIYGGQQQTAELDQEYQSEINLNETTEKIQKTGDDYAINLTSPEVVFVDQDSKGYNGLGVYDTASDKVVKYIDSMESLNLSIDEDGHEIGAVVINSIPYKITDEGLLKISEDVDVIYASDEGDLYSKDDKLYYNGLELAEFGEGKGQIDEVVSYIHQTGDYVFYQTTAKKNRQVLPPQQTNVFNIKTGETLTTDAIFEEIEYYNNNYYVIGYQSEDNMSSSPTRDVVVNEKGEFVDLQSSLNNQGACGILSEKVINNNLYTQQSCSLGDGEYENGLYKLNSENEWTKISVGEFYKGTSSSAYFFEDGVFIDDIDDENAEENLRYIDLDTMSLKQDTIYQNIDLLTYGFDNNAVIINKNGNEISTLTSIAVES